jgi:predicted SAM-dependent methyltransferase
MPFRNESVGTIYAEHVIEHFNNTELKKILNECERVLVDGGRLLIAIPNINDMLLHYNLKFEEFKTKAYFNVPLEINNNLDIINYMFYLDGHHKNSFNETNLKNYFREAGFSKCGLREFDPNFDSIVRKKESLYFYGEK